MTAATAPRATLLTRPMILICSASFGAMICFYLLLSVVPQYATSIGASGIGAGFATGALMLSTVATELATPRIVERFGYRLTLATGLALLGAPALALIGAHTMPAILAISLVRGAGLAIIVVVGGSLVASIVPPERRGEGLGLYGFIVNVPAVLGLPLGVWLAAHAGYPTVFIIAGLAALAGIAAVPGLPATQPAHEEPVGVLAGLLTPALARPAIVFSTTAMAAGVIVTFLPLAASHASENVIAAALFIQPAASTSSRWFAGHLGDKHGPATLLVPGVLLSAIGMAALILIGSTPAIIIGMVLFGIGFGITQNATLTLMFDRVSPSGYDAVSAVWNVGYDAGLGLGAVVFGFLSTHMGYPVAFAMLAAFMLAMVLPAWLDQSTKVVT
ncbi:MAG: MFS transporter [Gemmatimonas sp.]|nr:MFS transporter [Gemmatimonadaceae bacterium]